MNIKPKTTILYGAVRKADDSDQEYFSFFEAHLLQDEAYKIAAKTDAQIPAFAKANPVLRIGRFEVREVGS